MKQEIEPKLYNYHYFRQGAEASSPFSSLKEAEARAKRDIETDEAEPLRIVDDLGHTHVEWRLDPQTSSYEVIRHD